MKPALTLFLLFLMATAWAQDVPGPKFFISDAMNYEPWTKINPSQSKIVGTPYLDSAFVDGAFVYNNEKYSLPIRYNVYSDAFEARYEGQNMYLSENFIDMVMIKDARFIYYYHEGKKRVFEIIGQKGDDRLLKRRSKQLTTAVTGVPYQDDKPAAFEDRVPRYFALLSEGKLLEISNFNVLYKNYPDRKKELQAFIKKNKIKKYSEEDLKKLFAIL